MTGPIKTFVDVDLAEYSNCTMGTSALEIVDQIVANAIVLTRIRQAVIDVVFTILSLKSWRTFTLISTYEISTSGSILTGIGLTFINFLLAVTALISVGTNTLMAISNVSAVASVLTQ